MKGIKITGTGSYAPDTVVTNDDFAKFLETTDEWIYTRTGIKQRFYSTDKMNFQMAAIAAENALKNAGITAEDIDLIILSTCTPDFFYPNTACLVQGLIGAHNAACVDINTACTGFITALDMARRYICTGDHERVLVVASEFLTRQQDFTDRNSCFLFGDGAGAVVVEPADKPFYSVMGAKSDLLEALYCKVDYVCNMPLAGFNDYEGYLKDKKFDTPERNRYLQMDGKAVYRFAVDAMSDSFARVCEKAGVSTHDIDILVPHQANIRIINAALKSMDINPDNVYVNLETHGNTSSACIPTILDELNRKGLLTEGKKMALVGFGGGLTYGSLYMEL
ncbi:MAG: ketoacyl-ACP synthase III [[Eubacterium] siraeum]|nr:ketoacyl-ACP synthase III [[Eubacterium] siraeum]